MDIVFIDETFDLNQTKNYHISIQAGLNGYSFSILDHFANRYILLKHYAFREGITKSYLEERIEEIQKNDEFLTREFKSVIFSYLGPKYTMVPSPLFRKENLRTYFEFNHYLDDLDEIHFNRLKGTDAFIVFAVPSELSGIIHRSFGNVKFFSQATSLIENGLFQHGGRDAGKTAIVNIYGKFADIAVINGEKLLLCNTFPWNTDDDLVYHILYVFEQLRLNGRLTPLCISGEMQRTSPVYTMLKSYIKNVSFEKQNKGFSYSYTFNDVDQHWFVNLFNLKLCV